MYDVWTALGGAEGTTEDKVFANKTFKDWKKYGADLSSFAVSKLASLGVISGDENKNLNATGNLTRAEAAAILCRFSDKSSELKNKQDITHYTHLKNGKPINAENITEALLELDFEQSTSWTENINTKIINQIFYPELTKRIFIEDNKKNLKQKNTDFKKIQPGDLVQFKLLDALFPVIEKSQDSVIIPYYHISKIVFLEVPQEHITYSLSVWSELKNPQTTKTVSQFSVQPTPAPTFTNQTVATAPTPTTTVTNQTATTTKPSNNVVSNSTTSTGSSQPNQANTNAVNDGDLITVYNGLNITVYNGLKMQHPVSYYLDLAAQYPNAEADRLAERFLFYYFQFDQEEAWAAQVAERPWICPLPGESLFVIPKNQHHHPGYLDYANADYATWQRIAEYFGPGDDTLADRLAKYGPDPQSDFFDIANHPEKYPL